MLGLCSISVPRELESWNGELFTTYATSGYFFNLILQHIRKLMDWISSRPPAATKICPIDAFWPPELKQIPFPCAKILSDDVEGIIQEQLLDLGIFWTSLRLCRLLNVGKLLFLGRQGWIRICAGNTQFTTLKSIP